MSIVKRDNIAGRRSFTDERILDAKPSFAKTPGMKKSIGITT
jgi:hypothetical protein